MANSIKYNTGTEANALRTGNFHVGVGDASKGPTSTTGYYSTVNPPPGGYTIYVHNKNIGPSIQIASNDAELIRITNTIASTSYTTIDECFQYFSGEVDKMVVNRPMDFIITDGLVFCVTANIVSSYPRSGQYWNGLGNNNKNGVLTNGPTFNSNGYIEFDGVDDYSNTNFITGDFYNENGDWTINSTHNVVSNVTSGNSRSGISVNQRYKSEPDPGGFGINIVSGNYCVNLTHDDGNGNKESYQSLVQIPIDYGKIEHITAAWNNASKTINMYRNGELENTSTSTNYKWSPTTVSTRTHKLATSTQGGWGYYFPMEIASSQIYNRTLTLEEIKQNYYQAPIVTDGLIFAIDAGNLVSYENGSTTAYSLTGSVDGTLGGGTYYSPNNGGMFVFDGDNDYLQFATNPVFERGTTPFTMEAWVELLDNTGTSNISAVTGGGNPLCDNCSGGYFLYFMGSTSRVLNLRFDDSGLGNMDSISHTRSTSFEDGKFHHIVGLRDGTNTKLYLDGELVQTGTDNAVDVNDIGTFFISGWSNYRGNMNVGISRMYDRALTSEEVMQNYSAGKGRFSA
jgi:hypothetical protein